MKMKTLLVFFLTLFLGAGVATSQTSVSPLGSGSASDPYRISNLNNLYWLSKNTGYWSAGRYFVLTNDIDATSSSSWESGKGFSPIGSGATLFYSRFDGKGYKIKNLYINRSDGYLGMFGYLASGAVVSNLALENPTVRCSVPNDITQMGAITAVNYGSINNCHIVGGSVYGGRSYTGGIAGSSNGNIQYCTSTASISGLNYVGGIVGMFRAGVLSYCYSGGYISGTSAIGGLVGTLQIDGKMYHSYTTAFVNFTGSGGGGAVGTAIASATIQYCYAAGRVTGGTSPQGFLGTGTPTMSRCFWDTESTGSSTSAGSGAVGKTTAQMKDVNTFLSNLWDFKCETANGISDYWMIQSTSNNGYPILSWQGQGYSDNCPIWLGQFDDNMLNNANWSLNKIPANNSDIIMAENAKFDLQMKQNFVANNIIFNGAGKKIVLGNYDLQYSNATNANSDNYLAADGTGTAKKNISNGGNSVFHVGNQNYTPVTIYNHPGAADLFRVNISNGVLKEGTSGDEVLQGRVNSTWHIYKTNPNAGSGVSMDFSWNANSTAGLFTSPMLYHYGEKWERLQTNITSTLTSLRINNYQGTFSPFAIMDITSTLPISWGNVSVTKTGKNALIKWNTLSEEKSAYYLVQHSSNNTQWNNIAKLDAAGNSQDEQRYQFLHESPSAGLNYYRLILVDVDGKQEFSKVVSANFHIDKAPFTLFPNPATFGTVQVSIAEAGTMLVYNSAGVQVKIIALQAGTTTVDISALPTGVYQIKIHEETKTLLVR